MVLEPNFMGRECASRRARLRLSMGNHHDGLQKASRWFYKSNALVLQNHHDGFPFPSLTKPILLRFSPHSCLTTEHTEAASRHTEEEKEIAPSTILDRINRIETPKGPVHGR